MPHQTAKTIRTALCRKTVPGCVLRLCDRCASKLGDRIFVTSGPARIALHKTVLLHFSVQKVFCGLGIVRSTSGMQQSNQNTSSCCGEILPNARSNKKHQQLPWGHLSQILRSNKNTSICCGEILYTLLTIYYYSIRVWKCPRGGRDILKTHTAKILGGRGGNRR